MERRGFVLVCVLFVGCGSGGQPAAVTPAADADAAVATADTGFGADAGANVSTGPCYADPNTALRFADEALITQDDGVGCYAVYTVFADRAESFCPCPDPGACGPALAQLSDEASRCPASPRNHADE